KLGRRAEERAAQLLASLPAPLRAQHREPPLELRIGRADALLSDMRYSEAESAYVALERLAQSDARLLCRVRFGRAKAQLDRRARETGSALMAEVAESCTHDANQRAWARYYAGRAFSNLAKN